MKYMLDKEIHDHFMKPFSFFLTDIDLDTDNLLVPAGKWVHEHDLFLVHFLGRKSTGRFFAKYVFENVKFTGIRGIL